MKKLKFNFLLMLLVLFQIGYSQNNISIDTQYRVKPDKNLARDNATFYFDVTAGKLYYYDKDLKISKDYFIQYDQSFYDNDGLFNMVYGTDSVEHFLNKRNKSEIGLFCILYEEKNGKVLGVKTVFSNTNVNTYLTEEGSEIFN